jgi:hypothetical protein
LLVLEELDVALPNEIIGGPSSLGVRRPVLQDTASSVDRLEAAEDGRIVALGSQQSPQTFDPVVGGGVREVHPEDVVEDGVVVSRIVFTSAISNALCRPRLCGMST